MLIDSSIAKAQIRTAGVDLNGLMTVLSKHLYSTPAVAVRELVQNAHDSMVRRRIESDWQGGGSIRIEGDIARGVLKVTDMGAGLTDSEIHQYLATVGVGYTRNLRQKQADGAGDDELIGMFGLGFLSAFVLAHRVTVTTTSYQQPHKGWCYQSRNAEQYAVFPVAARGVGTVVELELKPDYLHLAGETSLRKILNHYCVLLREPIFIGQSAQALNPEPPPWRVSDNQAAEQSTTQKHRANLAFAARFEEQFEPIATMDVLPNESSDARGLLWIQDGATYGTSDNRNLSVFVRGMLLDDDARDLLPNWAGFVGGVIESSRLTPTASREDLQKDATYEAVQRTLKEALIDGLAHMAKHQPEAWRRVLLRHNEALLAAALCDHRLFALLSNDVRLPTSQGDMRARDLRDKNGVVHMTLGAQGGFEDMLFRALRVPVARGDSYAVIPFLREWVSVNGGSLIELGTEKGNRALFTMEDLPEDELTWLSEQLAQSEKLVPARFSPKELPLVVVPDRDAELKKRLEADEADKRMSMAALRLVRQFTAKIDASSDARLYVNLDNTAIHALLQAYRSGQSTDNATRLLRSLKIIMAASGEMQGDLDLNTALSDMSTAIASQLNLTSSTQTGR